MVDQTQTSFISNSSISPLGLFKVIICNIEKLKGGPWSPGTSGPSPYHAYHIIINQEQNQLQKDKYQQL